MGDNKESSADENAGISMRVMEIGVAVVFFIVGAIVMFDSYRLGSKWGSDGPQSGYFPFYIGLLICISSAVNFTQGLLDRRGRHHLFVGRDQLKLVLTVLLPAMVYVLGVKFVGLYIASAIYIAVFMLWLGHYSWLRSISVGLAVNISFFLMFEVWFKVPLFKGDLDPLRFLGY